VIKGGSTGHLTDDQQAVLRLSGVQVGYLLQQQPPSAQLMVQEVLKGDGGQQVRDVCVCIILRIKCNVQHSKNNREGNIYIGIKA
jgi:hypothetical protein